MTEDEALRRIQEAFQAGRYHVHPHAERRMRERNVTIADLRNAVAGATGVAPYQSDPPLGSAATTRWRVAGRDLDGDELTAGIDLTLDRLGSHALVVTVF